MKQVVHILATVRKPELLRAALLVFSTLRVGFPTADVCVWGNGLAGDATAAVAAEAARVGARFHNLPATSHDCWIDGLIAQANGPFWILDTDVVFHSTVEGFAEGAAGGTPALLRGRFEPDFYEEFTDTVHVARLHTCLMWIDGPALRCAMRGWMARFPLPWRNSAQFDLVHQHFIPRAGGKALFYDSMAGVYQALVTSDEWRVMSFSAEEDGCFDHLHFATYVDQVEGSLHGVKGGLRERFELIYDAPGLAKGILAEQRSYYAKRNVVESRESRDEGQTSGLNHTKTPRKLKVARGVI